MKSRMVITGVSGLLGNNLALHFSDRFDVVGLYFCHPVAFAEVGTLGVDLADYRETRETFRALKPLMVLHCASRTDVDAMQSDSEGAWRANVLATRNVLDALRDSLAKLVYISSDSVYPGERGPYAEGMPVGPRNVYGETKLAGESLVVARPGSLILRTNLYGWNVQAKEGIGEWFLHRLLRGERVRGFVDARFSATYTLDLAAIIERCLDRDLSGVYNCAARDSWTKFEFGRRMAEHFGLDPSLVQPCSMRDAGLAAPRGSDLSLDVSRLERDLGQVLPTVEQGLEHFCRDFRGGLPQRIREGRAGLPAGPFHPHRNELFYGSQALDQADIQAVVRVLKSPFLTQGEEVSSFENEVARFVGARFGVAVSSGTAALHLACLACGLGPGDEAVTSPNTFLASANCAAYCGATPVFADIDPRTYNLSPAALEKKINARTSLVIPVHFAGQSCDMEAIRAVVAAKEREFGRKIFILEDASHALGSLHRGSPVGCCGFSDLAVFSFHPVKHITTGEGGMVLTNEQSLAERVRKLANHGVIRAEMSQNPGPWYYEQVDLGFNYRLTDIQCGLGRSQLAKLPWFRERRRRIVERYNKAFADLPHVTVPFEDRPKESNFHLYVLGIDFADMGLGRGQVMEALRSRGIHTQVHYIPVHLQPYYRKSFGTGPGDCPVAEAYYDRCLSLPLYPRLSDAEVEQVAGAVVEVLRGRKPGPDEEGR